MMSINKIQVARQFNASVYAYDQHATVQQQMAHHLLQLLQRRKQPIRRICEIGCGTGYLTQLLMQHYPESQLVAIDLASQMIEKAKRRVGDANVQWVVGDAEQFNPSDWEPFDCVISNATIQWLYNPTRTFRLWREALRPGGEWVASTFGIDTFQELSMLFHQVEKELGTSCVGKRYLPMHSAQYWNQLLKQIGFTSVSIAEERQQKQYRDSRTFLQTIKAMGASYSEATSTLLTDYRVLKTVIERYDQLYRIGSQVYATYHVIYLYGKSSNPF